MPIRDTPNDCCSVDPVGLGLDDLYVPVVIMAFNNASIEGGQGAHGRSRWRRIRPSQDLLIKNSKRKLLPFMRRGNKLNHYYLNTI